MSNQLWEGTLIEGLAQTAAILNGFHHSHPLKRNPAKGLLVGVKKFKILRSPQLGDTVQYQVELIRQLPPLILVRGQAHVGDEPIANGELKFFVQGTE